MNPNPVLGFFAVILWIFSYIITFKYWEVLPIWSKILAIIGLIVGLMSNIIVSALKLRKVDYNNKNNKNNKNKNMIQLIRILIVFISCVMTIVIVYIGKNKPIPVRHRPNKYALATGATASLIGTM